ncbi:PEP-CTERM sorting domain-containing protein [Roseateles sp. LYH14W]|uniref:PEP-CTERM sorting domain-containing protein n=1 Tax=Pelomonas parva TaxID=3299032 RepID=A0ABW7F624_9BURK
MTTTFAALPCLPARSKTRPHGLRRAAQWLATLALAPLAASAQVATLPDAAPLTAVYDFSALAPGSYTTFTGSFGAVGFTASQMYAGSDARLVRTTPAFYGPGFAWYDNLLFASGIEGVRLDFATPLHDFGAGAIGNITGGYVMTLRLYADDVLLGSVSASGSAGWQGNSGVTFIGAHSATAFDRVEITGPAYGFAMNHLAIGQVAAPVPEPASAALMALGMAGIALAARRRQRRD